MLGPFDVGLERFVVAKGREFLGREALRNSTPEWELFYAELHADGIDIHGGEPVLCDGEAVGLTTSGGYGYTVDASLGWLFVRKGTPKEGLNVQILNHGPIRSLCMSSRYSIRRTCAPGPRTDHAAPCPLCPM